MVISNYSHEKKEEEEEEEQTEEEKDRTGKWEN